MTDKLSKLITRRFQLVLAVLMLLALAPQHSVAQDNNNDAQISESEKHFRDGVSLYKRGNYREALDEFNRVLAIDPSHEEAKSFQSKTEKKLLTNEVEGSANVDPPIEIFDPDSLKSLDNATLTAEEFKIQRVRENVELGERYLEHNMFKEAVDKFEQVLITAPDNKRAQRGLHEATLGYDKEQISESQLDLVEQTQRVRRGIEEKKIMPEGAGVDGIKSFNLTIPTIEERVNPIEERSQIEDVLDQPVSVVFEELHLNDLLEVLSDN